MNGQQIFDHQLTIMQAIKDGVPVQVRGGPRGLNWTDFAITDDFKWMNFEYEFRIKPVPKEVFVNEYPNGNSTYFKEEDAKRMGSKTALRTAVRYREVIEE